MFTTDLLIDNIDTAARDPRRGSRMEFEKFVRAAKGARRSVRRIKKNSRNWRTRKHDKQH